MDEDGELEFFNKNRPKDRVNCYKVVRKYYNHKGSTDFHRMALFLEGMLLLSYCNNENTFYCMKPWKIKGFCCAINSMLLDSSSIFSVAPPN